MGSPIKPTHEVYRVRGSRTIRQFRSEEAAVKYAARLRVRFKGNRYGVRPAQNG